MNIFYMYCMRKRKINKIFLNIFKISYHKLRINLYRRNFRMSTIKLNGFWQILRFPEILLYIYDQKFSSNCSYCWLFLRKQDVFVKVSITTRLFHTQYTKLVSYFTLSWIKRTKYIRSVNYNLYKKTKPVIFLNIF